MLGKSLNEILDDDIDKLTEKDRSTLLFGRDPKFDSDEAKRRNAIIIECPICHIRGNEPNMRRWHFNNCSQSLLTCQECGGIIPRQGTKPFLYKHKKFCGMDCYTENRKGTAPIIMTLEVRKKLSLVALSQSKERSERMKTVKPWLKSSRGWPRNANP